MKLSTSKPYALRYTELVNSSTQLRRYALKVKKLSEYFRTTKSSEKADHVQIEPVPQYNLQRWL